MFSVIRFPLTTDGSYPPSVTSLPFLKFFFQLNGNCGLVSIIFFYHGNSRGFGDTDGESKTKNVETYGTEIN